MRLARHILSRAHEVREKTIPSIGTARAASGASPAIKKPVRTTDATATHQVAGRIGSTRRPHPAPMRVA
jgi:hypothetical protein